MGWLDKPLILTVRCSSVGLADGECWRRTRNACGSSVWNYRIHWRLLRMRKTGRCSATSNTRHQQRSEHRFDAFTLIITDRVRTRGNAIA